MTITQDPYNQEAKTFSDKWVDELYTWIEKGFAKEQIAEALSKITRGEWGTILASKSFREATGDSELYEYLVEEWERDIDRKIDEYDNKAWLRYCDKIGDLRFDFEKATEAAVSALVKGYEKKITKQDKVCSALKTENTKLKAQASQLARRVKKIEDLVALAG